MVSLSHLLAILVIGLLSWYHSACVQMTLILLMATKHENSDAGNSDVPKRGCKALPLSEKVGVLDLTRKGKKLYAEAAKIYSKNKSSIHEIVRKEKEIHASFAGEPQTAKVTATVHDECFVKMEQAFSLYNKVF